MDLSGTLIIPLKFQSRKQLLNLKKKIQECTTYADARPILEKAGARNNTKKLIETSFSLLDSNPNGAIRAMKSAIKEMEYDGIADNEVHEEELSNNNTGKRTDGSEQSTENEAPFSGEGNDTTDGEKAMQDLDGAVNQWGETHPAPGATGIPSGTPPPGAMPPQQGMPPNQMIAPPTPSGAGLPPMEPIEQMDPQMQQYIQYLINQEMQNYHSQVTNKTKESLGRVVSQFTAKQNQQKEAIKSLSHQLQEAIASNNSMKYDLGYMRKNANATFRETVPALMGIVPGGFGKSRPQNRPYSKYNDLAQARAEITEMDNILKSR